MRITVFDVLDYLAAGMTHEEILTEFPYLTETDIRACLAYAADRERRLAVVGDEAFVRREFAAGLSRGFGGFFSRFAARGSKRIGIDGRRGDLGLCQGERVLHRDQRLGFRGA